MKKLIIQYNFLRINTLLPNNNDLFDCKQKKFNSLIQIWDISAYNYNLKTPGSVSKNNQSSAFDFLAFICYKFF